MIFFNWKISKKAWNTENKCVVIRLFLIQIEIVRLVKKHILYLII